MAKMSPEDFVAFLAPAVQAVAKEYPIVPSVCIAQGALESGWYEAAIGEFNIFGRKYNGTGPIEWCWTKENYSEEERSPEDQDEQHIYLGDGWWSIYAAFQGYTCLEDAIRDYAILICEDEKYAEVVACKDNPDEYLAKLAPIYATDPGYYDIVKSIIDSNELEQYN